MCHLLVVIREGREWFLKEPIEETILHFIDLKTARESVEDLLVDIVVINADRDNIWDSLDFLRSYKMLHPQVPVIFISEISNEDIVLNAYRGGAREFLRSPVDPSYLRTLVRTLYKIKKTSKERRAVFGHREGDRDRRYIPLNLLKVLNFIEKNFNRDISLSTLAEKANLSKYYFCRFFKHYMGVTPKQYIIKRRIEEAKRLLKEEEMDISDIAFRVGFSYLNHFERQFKKYTSQSPKEYRKSLRKRPSI